MNGHDLGHWLTGREGELAAAHVRAELGRGPTVGPTRGPTWISFESANALGRVVLSAAGRCDLTVTSRRDGAPRMDEHRELATSAELDGALVTLVAHLA